MITTRKLVENFPENIFLIGCGGTGARIAEELKFFMRVAMSASSDLVRTTIWLIDHDLVEWKNCERQPFVPSNIGYPKSFVKSQYLNNFVRVNHVPEPLNQETIGQVFTPEILAKNFLVISAVDNKPTRSMVYHYLLENATKAEDKTWFWVFSGGEMKIQKLETNSVLPTESDYSGQYDLPFVTNLSYGYHKGNPTNTLAPHERFPDEFPSMEGVFGMNRHNRIVGCGLAAGDEIRQSYTMNNLASVMTMFMLDRFYFDGLVPDQVTFIDGKMDCVYLGSLDDLGTELTPDLLEQIASTEEDVDEMVGFTGDNTATYVENGEPHAVEIPYDEDQDAEGPLVEDLAEEAEISF